MGLQSEKEPVVMRAYLVVVLLLLLAPYAVRPAVADAPLSIDSLSWLAGDWRGTDEDGTLEEHYSPMNGASILGTSRIVSKGVSVHLEWILIEQTSDGVFLTVSLPKKQKTVTFKLMRVNGTSWSFETTDRPKVERLTYTREGADAVAIKLEKEHDGKPFSFVFRMRRQFARTPGK